MNDEMPGVEPAEVGCECLEQLPYGLSSCILAVVNSLYDGVDPRPRPECPLLPITRRYIHI